MKRKDPDAKLDKPVLYRLTAQEMSALVRAASEADRSRSYIVRLYVTDRLIEEGFLKAGE